MDRHTSPDSVCRDYDRTDSSLIEEPEICENCRYFKEAGELCRFPEAQQ